MHRLVFGVCVPFETYKPLNHFEQALAYSWSEELDQEGSLLPADTELPLSRLEICNSLEVPMQRRQVPERIRLRSCPPIVRVRRRASILSSSL